VVKGEAKFSVGDRVEHRGTCGTVKKVTLRRTGNKYHVLYDHRDQLIILSEDRLKATTTQKPKVLFSVHDRVIATDSGSGYAKGDQGTVKRVGDPIMGHYHNLVKFDNRVRPRVISQERLKKIS